MDSAWHCISLKQENSPQRVSYNTDLDEIARNASPVLHTWKKKKHFKKITDWYESSSTGNDCTCPDRERNENVIYRILIATRCLKQLSKEEENENESEEIEECEREGKQEEETSHGTDRA